MILSLAKQFGGYVALGLLVVFLWMRLDAVAAERDLAQAQVGNLSDKIEDQNEGIRQLQQAGERNREIYLAGIDAANRRAVRLEINAEDILNLPEPTPSEACEATEELLRKGL